MKACKPQNSHMLFEIDFKSDAYTLCGLRTLLLDSISVAIDYEQHSVNSGIAECSANLSENGIR